MEFWKFPPGSQTGAVGSWLLSMLLPPKSIVWIRRSGSRNAIPPGATVPKMVRVSLFSSRPVQRTSVGRALQ